MARRSLFDRYEPFIIASILGAHANTLNKGFRQYHVRVFIEIFTNWFDFSESYASLPVQHTQIGRYLEDLVNDGFARKLAGKKQPTYRLTRTGLIEIISRFVSNPYFSRREHFYFVYHIIEAYRGKLIKMVQMEGQRFPYTLQLELESLLDLEALVERQMDYIQRELRKLEKRIETQLKVKDLSDEMVSERKKTEEIIRAVDKLYPFGINEFRRYSELLTLATQKAALWELQIGSIKRAEQIWQPARAMLILHLEELKRFRELAKQEVEKKAG